MYWKLYNNLINYKCVDMYVIELYIRHGLNISDLWLTGGFKGKTNHCII